MSARGAVSEYRLGNGVQVSALFNDATGLQTGVMAAQATSLFNEAYRYDGRGNLSSRTDTVQGRIEALNYDAHNRLVLSTSLKNNAAELSSRYAYDVQGNMLQRGKTVHAACQTFSTVNNVKVCTQWTGTNQNQTSYYRYRANIGESLAGPHAVRGLSGAETASFHYDANGNQLQGSTQNSYNLADQLIKASKGATQVEFAYAPDGDRYVRIDQSNGKRQTTLSLGGYERVDDETWLTHKYSVGGILLITETEKPDDARSFSRDLTYLVKDYLGSVRLELDGQGKERNRMHYAAFGEQYSDPIGGGLITNGPRIELNRLQNRGSTYHEEIASLGLIHMNGRVYDPKLARFLQADPYVQDAGNLQALNRYSYVENNPFAATDPSGFFLKKLGKFIKRYWRPIVAIVVTVVTYGAASAWVSGWGATWGTAATAATATSAATAATLTTAGSMVAGAMAGAAGGFVGGALQTKSLSGALRGAASGAITGAAFGGVNGYYGEAWTLNRVAATSLAGGASSQFSGGSFANGVKFAFTSSMLRYGYNKMVNYDATFESGGDAVRKYNDTYSVKGANNIGIQGEPLNSEKWLNEGGRVSRFLNKIPGVNAVAGLHDVFKVEIDRYMGGFARTVLNVPGMAPASLATYGSLMTNTQVASIVGAYKSMEKYY